MRSFTLIFISFFLFFKIGYTQSIDTILQLQVIEVKAPRLQTFQTGKKRTTFDTFQKLTTVTQDLGAALNLNTPIFIKNYGPGRLATTAIRGASASQTAVIWNGFNINSPMLGQTDFSLIPTFFIDEIGVEYGSNSTAWGSGAIGGAIILTNKNQFSQGWKGEWESKTGSFGNFFNGIGTSFSNDHFTSTTKVFYQTGKNDFPIQNGQSDRLTHAEINKWGILQKNGFIIKNNQQVDLTIWYQDADRNLPPNLVQRTSVAEQADESLRTTLNWKYIRNQSVFQIRSGLFYERLFFQDATAGIDSRSRTWTSRSEVEWTKNITKQHRLNIGANYAYLKANATGYDKESPTQNRTAIFAMYNWKNTNEKWRTQLSIRQEWVAGSATPFIPSIGFSGQLNKYLTINSTIAKSYRVPTFNDLFWRLQGNQSLLPENGWNQEFGLTYTTREKWHFTTTAYNRTVANWILWQPETGVWRPSNLLKVWSRGIENILKWQTKINELTLDFSIQYDFTLSQNRAGTSANDASVGKQLIYVPKHKFNAQLKAIYKNWTFAFYHQYTGHVYTLVDNSDFLPAYHLDHLHVYRTFKTKQLTGNAFVKANNILGINYQVIAQFPLPQQNFEVGWSIGF
ncbi:MAG: TonB-dependent receptor plug domain-containing protein [Saprospiraceae bacterium]